MSEYIFGGFGDAQDDCFASCSDTAKSAIATCKKKFPVNTNYETYSMCVRAAKDAETKCFQKCGGASGAGEGVKAALIAGGLAVGLAVLK